MARRRHGSDDDVDDDEARADEPFEEQLRQLVAQLVQRGFNDAEMIIDTAADELESKAPPEVRGQVGALAARITEELLAEHMIKQATWPTPTNNERLNAAFEALEADGIIARQDWTCCMSCGTGSIFTEYDDARAEEREGALKGFVFYHGQDTDSAAEDGTVLLAFGSFGGDRSNELDRTERSTAVARQVVATLERFQLDVSWDGNVMSRIVVNLGEWRWRRPQPGAPKAAAVAYKDVERSVRPPQEADCTLTFSRWPWSSGP